MISRSSIIRRLDGVSWTSANDVANDVNLSATTVLYHLRHMRRERVVEREAEGTKWRLAEPGQTALTSYLTSQGQRTPKKSTRKERPKGRQSGKGDSRRKWSSRTE